MEIEQVVCLSILTQSEDYSSKTISHIYIKRHTHTSTGVNRWTAERGNQFVKEGKLKQRKAMTLAHTHTLRRWCIRQQLFTFLQCSFSLRLWTNGWSMTWWFPGVSANRTDSRTHAFLRAFKVQLTETLVNDPALMEKTSEIDSFSSVLVDIWHSHSQFIRNKTEVEIRILVLRRRNERNTKEAFISDLAITTHQDRQGWLR